MIWNMWRKRKMHSCLHKFFAAVFTVSLVACNNRSEVTVTQSPTEDFTACEIKLADSLGTVNINLPARYDTSFTWIHYSDCGKPCDNIKYRFQPAMLKIVKESGWIWENSPKDSIERFTIFHSGYFPFGNKNDSLIISSYHGLRKKNINQEPFNYPIKSDTIEKIGNHFFSIITMDAYDSTFGLHAKKLLATTNIKNNPVYFDFELLTKQAGATITENFLHNAYAYLRSIRIDSAK